MTMILRGLFARAMIAGIAQVDEARDREILTRQDPRRRAQKIAAAKAKRERKAARRRARA